MTTYRNAMPVDPGLGLGRAQLLELLNWIVDTHMGYAIPGNTGLDLFATQTHYDKRAAELEGLARLAGRQRAAVVAVLAVVVVLDDPGLLLPGPFDDLQPSFQCQRRAAGELV